ncbi:MAG: helix-turn-helix transcriptional regulator [Chitinophagales bacterium]|nr:helix-turn-helix transcriptional regulator [Chitinophagales bacterium]
MERKYQEQFKVLGEKIRDLRKSKGLSQLDLELESGINRTEISRIENGIKNIELLTLFKIKDALKIEIHELFVK